MLIKSLTSRPLARLGSLNNFVLLVQNRCGKRNYSAPESLEEFGEVGEFRVITEDFD